MWLIFLNDSWNESLRASGLDLHLTIIFQEFWCINNKRKNKKKKISFAFPSHHRITHIPLPISDSHHQHSTTHIPPPACHTYIKYPNLASTSHHPYPTLTSHHLYPLPTSYHHHHPFAKRPILKTSLWHFPGGRVITSKISHQSPHHLNGNREHKYSQTLKLLIKSKSNI